MAKKNMKWFHWILSVLIAIALINWGTVAWFDFNIVELITFGVGWLAKTVYTLVAVLGLFGLIALIRKAL